MRRPNGHGTIAKLPGNRRRPFAVKVTTGWTEKGTQQYKYLSYHKSYKEALQALNKYVEDPYDVKDITMSELWEEWYPLQDDKVEGTRRSYRVAWKHLEPFHDMKIRDIDRFMLQRFYDDPKFTINSANTVKVLLKLMFDYAVSRGMLPVSALEMQKLIDFSSKKASREITRKVITKEEEQSLWEKNDDISKIILVYLYTGLRYSELYELMPENCFDDHIKIVHAKTKAGIRTVPLCDKVQKLLPIEPVPAYDSFNELFKNYLPGHHIHDTRHTFITRLTEQNVNQDVIKAIVGHSRGNVTSKYIHISLEMMLDAVNKL